MSDEREHLRKYKGYRRCMYKEEQAKMKRNKIIFGGTLLCVFCVMLILTCMTPLLVDDYSYCFSYADRTQRITSIKDIIVSMAAHRKTMNGRVFSHSLVQFFLMLPKGIFNVFNALNATILLYVTWRYARGTSEGHNILLLYCAIFMIWIFMPVFGQVFLWLDGSLNYSWTMSVTLGFLWPFFSLYMGTYREPGKVKTLLFVLFSFIAGGYSESASCAVLFTAFCFAGLAYLRERRIPRQLVIAFIAGCAGFLFMMLAPSEIGGRTSSFELARIAHNIQQVFVLPQKFLLALYCILGALMAMSIVSGVDKKKIIAAAVLFAGSVVSVGVYIFAAYFPWRSLCPPTFYLIISCLILLNGLFEIDVRLISPALTGVLGAMFVFSFVLGVGDIGVVYYESRQREATIYAAVEAGEDWVEVYWYSGNTKYCASYAQEDIYDEPGRWPNYDLEAYYGIEAIVGKPLPHNYFEGE